MVYGPIEIRHSHVEWGKCYLLAPAPSAKWDLQGIQNVHLVALPLFGGKSADVQYSLVDKALTAVDVDWKYKVISVANDGEATMTGHVSGLQTRIEAAVKAATGSEIVRVWCGLHQLDLVLVA